MARTSTSFRLSEAARQRLAARAQKERTSATSLLERLILEGLDALEYPGIVHRGPANDRRAGLAAGPDVWEVVARLRQLEGSEEHRILVLSDETELHPRQIRQALEYASRSPDEVTERIARNDAAIVESRNAADRRRSLLA